MTSRSPAPPRHRSQYVLLAGLAVSVAYAVVHIAFSDPALIEGTAPARLSLRNYLGPVLGSGMVWALFAYLMGKACSHRWTTAFFAGAGILLLMLAVHYGLLSAFGIYDWQTAFLANAAWFLFALIAGPLFGAAGAFSHRLGWLDYVAVLGFVLEPLVTGLIPGNGIDPQTTTTPGYLAAVTLWMIGAVFFYCERRAPIKG